MEQKIIWKITFHLQEKDLFFYVLTYQERDGRILFTDTKTGLAKNLPYNKCSIEQAIARVGVPQWNHYKNTNKPKKNYQN